VGTAPSGPGATAAQDAEGWSPVECSKALGAAGGWGGFTRLPPQASTTLGPKSSVPLATRLSAVPSSSKSMLSPTGSAAMKNGPLFGLRIPGAQPTDALSQGHLGNFDRPAEVACSWRHELHLLSGAILYVLWEPEASVAEACGGSADMFACRCGRCTCLLELLGTWGTRTLEQQGCQSGLGQVPWFSASPS
jgi:hypothetical protein